jgi:hypothetical protein
MPELLELISLGLGAIGALILAEDQIAPVKKEIFNIKTVVWGIIFIFLGFLLPASWISYNLGRSVSELNGVLKLVCTMFIIPIVGLAIIFFNSKNKMNTTRDLDLGTKAGINQRKIENRVVWLDFLMFAASVLLQGVHIDWLFWLAGGLGIIAAFVGILRKFLPFPFVIRGSPSNRENRLVWLAFLMFAVSLFLQGFHKDLGFWIAGGFGLLTGAWGFIAGSDWDRR